MNSFLEFVGYLFSMVFMGLHFLIIFYFIFGLGSEVLLLYNFLNFDSLDISLVFVFDYVSLGFSSFVVLISSVVFMYTNYYMKGDSSLIRFFILLVLFVMSMICLVYGYNLFSLMIGWDGLGIVSFLLVIYYTNFSSLRSGLLTVLSNRIGDLGMLFSFYLFFEVGWWSFFSYSLYDLYFLSFMIIFSSMTKSAQFPFSAWLPAAMAAPTPVSSLVHSSTLVTAGVYLLIRFYYSLCFILSSEGFCLISLFTMFFSGFLAFYDNDMKKIIAMSTLSQLGFMMFSLSIGEWLFSFFHMVCHALYKSLLFLSCGSFIIFGFGSQELRSKFILGFVSSFYFLLFVFSSMSLFGFPFLSGFFSKDYILEVSFLGDLSFMIMLFLMMSCSFTFVYSMRLVAFGLYYYMSSFVYSFFCSTKLSIFFLSILFFWSLFWGSYCGGLIFCDNLFFVFTVFKILGIVLMILGMLIFYLFYFKVQTKLYSKGFSDFIYLFWMSDFLLSFYSFKWLIFIVNDSFWLELLLPKFSFKFNYLSFYLINLEYTFYKIICVVLGIIFFFLMVYSF